MKGVCPSMSDPRLSVAQFCKYGLTGGCGTVVHYVWLVLLSDFAPGVAPIRLVLSGAFAGAVVNYLLNYRFTFASARRHLFALPRFLLLSGFNASASALAVFAFTAHGLPFMWGQFAATAVCLPCGFFVSRRGIFE